MGHDEKQALTRPVPICLRFAVAIFGPYAPEVGHRLNPNEIAEALDW